MDRRLALYRPRTRRLALPVETVLLLAALPFLAGAIAVAAGSGGHHSGRGVEIGLAVATALGTVWLIRNLPRAGRSSTGAQPELEVTGEELVLEDPIVLREPLRLPRAQLAAVAIEESGRRRRRGLGTSLARFRLAGGEAWAWSARAGSRLPRLGHVRDLPNVAIVLAQPLRVPQLRDFGRGWFVGQPPHGRLRAGDPLPGLLLTLAEPAALREALAGDPVARELRAADLDPLPRRSPAHDRNERFERGALVAFGIYLVLEQLFAFGAL